MWLLQSRDFQLCVCKERKRAVRAWWVVQYVRVSGAVCLVHHCIAIARKLSVLMPEQQTWALATALRPAPCKDGLENALTETSDVSVRWFTRYCCERQRGAHKGHVCFTSHAVTVALPQGHFGCPLGLPASDIENIMNTFLLGKKLS